jgi:hypothetical protein
MGAHTGHACPSSRRKKPQPRADPLVSCGGCFRANSPLAAYADRGSGRERATALRALMQQKKPTRQDPACWSFAITFSQLWSQSKSAWTLALPAPQNGHVNLSPRSVSRVPSGHLSVSMRIEYSQQSSAQQISRPCTPEARKSPRVVDCGRLIIETSAIDERGGPI